MPCKANELAEVKLFELLDKDDLQSLAEVIDSARLNENEILFHMGEPGESLYRTCLQFNGKSFLLG